jgi:hypothetical protein
LLILHSSTITVRQPGTARCSTLIYPARPAKSYSTSGWTKYQTYHIAWSLTTRHPLFNSQSSPTAATQRQNSFINIQNISNNSHQQKITRQEISQTVHVPSSQDKTKQSSTNNLNKINAHEQKFTHLHRKTIVQSRFPITQNPRNN